MSWIKNILTGGAEKVITAVGDAFDKNFTNKEEREAAKLAVQKEINRHFEALEANANKELELILQDKDSARKRETEFIKATGHIDWMHTIVGAIVMICFILMTYLLFTKTFPEKSEHIIINLVGILEGAVMLVVGYYFGSSAGSRIKDMRGK